jgi:hypothetical protein
MMAKKSRPRFTYKPVDVAQRDLRLLQNAQTNERLQMWVMGKVLSRGIGRYEEGWSLNAMQYTKRSLSTQSNWAQAYLIYDYIRKSYIVRQWKKKEKGQIVYTQGFYDYFDLLRKLRNELSMQHWITIARLHNKFEFTPKEVFDYLVDALEADMVSSVFENYVLADQRSKDKNNGYDPDATWIANAKSLGKKMIDLASEPQCDAQLQKAFLIVDRMISKRTSA